MSSRLVADALRRRNVRRVVHLHTDHFEPWRPFPHAENSNEACMVAVERFIERCDKNPVTRRQTLFYKPHINYELDASRELYRADPDDKLGFVPEPESDERNFKRMLGGLVEAGHELQLHIHHENFNFNARPATDATQRYLIEEDGWRYDTARLELSVVLNLANMRRACGKPDATWFFVHGHWALNSSDVKECTIVREIELLMRNGCAGDFTFPAGRDHVDPRAAAPFLVRPVALPMGYDRREAGSTQALGAGFPPRERFFIWQTSQRHRLCSLDYFSPFVRKRFEDPGATAITLAEEGCVLGDTLYHKTHAHSMHPRYWEGEANPMPPLLHPGAQAELGMLFDGAEVMGATIEFSTASEVYRQVTGAPSVPAAPPQVSTEPMFGRQSVTFVDTEGRLAEAPPLHPQITKIPAPAVHIPRLAGSPTPARPIIVEAVVPSRPAASESALTGDETDLTVLANRIDAVACAAALERHASIGPEQSGVTGFYITHAQQGTLLSPAERRLAKHVLATPGIARVYEIGAGLGVLTSLLAAAGVQAVAVERHSGRHETSQAIFKATTAAYPSAAGRARIVKGKFPLATEFDTGLNRCAALLTNLLGGADFEEQLHVIQGLRGFRYLFVDLSKFYERRPDMERQRELIRLFRVAGFREPRDLFDLGDDGRYVRFTNPSPQATNLTEVAWRRTKRKFSRMMKQWRKKG